MIMDIKDSNFSANNIVLSEKNVIFALVLCAKAIVAKCKDAGVVMTGAGATYPYGKDPHDSNIRIAPSFPTLEDLKLAAEIFCVCVKLVSIDKLLAE